ncbi:MAG: M20 family metallopeptidase [Candidatus Thorarchaeota archaeon]
MMVNESRILGLLKELVATNSENPPGNERGVAEVLRDYLSQYDIKSKEVGDNEDRPNLIFSTHDGDFGNLLMHGHMDTVPVGSKDNWSYDPFGAKVSSGRLYGRGACDMKGPLAALAETMIQYKKENHEMPLVMLATSDEEAGLRGAQQVSDSGILEGIKWGVCAEPTSLGILLGGKGTFWVKLRTTGKSAHGSRPQEGINAISLCIEALEAITGEQFEYDESLLGAPTVNIGVIEGGAKINVVPEYCEAQIDMRTVEGQTTEYIAESMKSRLESAGLDEYVQIDIIDAHPPVLTPKDAEIVIAAKEAITEITGTTPELATATYGTDCSVLQPDVGITNVICGPGSIEQAHQPDEYIEIKELLTSVGVYLQIARYFANVY